MATAPILAGDIKLLASKVMDDVPNGGGGPTGTVIPDGVSNAIFGDVTERARAGGSVSIRQLHLAVQTPNTAAYMDPSIIVSKLPNDANVSITLVKCDVFAQRKDIANAIENYLIQGPEWGGYLLENHVAGQRSIQIFQRPGTPTPPIGRTLVLISSEGLPAEIRQFVRVTRVEVEQRTFSFSSGSGIADFPADVVVCDLTDALRSNFAGSAPSRLYARDSAKTVIRDTTVADAATFYGASPLTAFASLGDSRLKVASIFTQLVPSARTEVIALDQRPAAQRLLQLATSPRQITVGAAPHTTRIKVGQENRGFSWVNILKPFPAPNTLVVSYMAQGVWYTLTDDGAGGFTGAGVGTVNYANGSVSITTQALPDVGSAIIYSWGEKSAFTNRSGQAGFRAPEYALKLEHTGIKPGTLVATWMSGGTLRSATANAAGVVSGDASGEFNAASGTLYIRPGYMPDAGAQFVFAYEWAAVVTKSVLVSPDAGGFATINLDTVPAPKSVVVRWITVNDVSATGGAATGGSASTKGGSSTSTTVWEPNPDYVAPEQPVVVPPTVVVEPPPGTSTTVPPDAPVDPDPPIPPPTGAPISITRVPVNEDYTRAYFFPPHMASGGTRATTGGAVYIQVPSEMSPSGTGTYPVPDASGAIWTEQEYDIDKKKIIGGVTYTLWGPNDLVYSR